MLPLTSLAKVNFRWDLAFLRHLSIFIILINNNILNLSVYDILLCSLSLIPFLPCCLSPKGFYPIFSVKTSLYPNKSIFSWVLGWTTLALGGSSSSRTASFTDPIYPSELPPMRFLRKLKSSLLKSLLSYSSSPVCMNLCRDVCKLMYIS